MKKLLSATALALTLSIAGFAYANDDWHDKGEMHGHGFMHEELAKLPKDKAEKFEATLKDAREKNKPLFDQMHKLHEELRAILTAPKFDKAAYIAKNEELHKFRETMHEKLHASMSEAFATALSQLSQEDRKTLASAMDEHFKAHKEEMHEHHDDHKDKDSKGSEE